MHIPLPICHSLFHRIIAQVSGHPIRRLYTGEATVIKLVHVISFTLFHRQAVCDALDYLHQLQTEPDDLRCPILLFCDLPDAGAPKLPLEDSLIQTLHTGIKAMNAQHAESCFLLIRRRVWDDAARQYLGISQKLSCREVIAQLMLQGDTDAAFELTNIAPEFIKGRWDAVLFSDISVSCTLDTPIRAAAYLEIHKLSAVGLRILPRREYPRSALEYLSGHIPFSLSPQHAAKEYELARHGQVSADHPALYTLQGLSRIKMRQPVPVAPQCCFIFRHAPDWPSVFSSYRRLCRIAPLSNACVPLIQFAFLAAAAVFGMPLFSVCTLLPELWTLLHPRAWPSVLLRMALLPLTALHALDVLLCRLLARSPLFRLRVPSRLFSPLFCLFAALVLLTAAFVSVYALVSVLPFAFIWLCMPVLYPVLDQVDDGAAAPNPA